jgi:tetratricopeptide (TPR) repeat protein
MEPNNLESLMEEGKQAFNRGDYQLALQILDQAIHINPQCEDAWCGKSQVLYELQEYEKAIQCYDQAIHINPLFKYIWANKGKVLYKLQEYEKAIQCYDQAIQINPQFEGAWNDKGNVLRKLKEYEKAIQCYAQAIQINPQFAKAWNGKGVALSKLKEYEKAIKCYDQAIQINPQLTEAWEGKGIILCDHLSQYQKSIACFEKILQLTENQYYLAWRNKSVALDKLGYKIKAIENLDIGLKSIKPEVYFYQEGMGELYLFKGNLEFSAAEMQSMPNERRHYRERAENSYQLALEFFLFEPAPEIKFQAFPEQHLDVYQKLIKVCRYTRPNDIPEMIRQVDDLLARFLANPDYSESRKIAMQRKLADYQQLRIDDLIKSDQKVEALELAEQRKNDCLRWLLSLDNQKIISPNYQQIQTLLNPHTAIIYWHISPTAISTFILKYNQAPIVKTVLFQGTNLTDNLQRFESWLDQWLKNYDDYCQPAKTQTKQPDYKNLQITLDKGGIKLNIPQSVQPKNTSKDRANHPWRQTMISQIEELRDILKIKDICQDLTEVKNLILIPHRSLHTLPLERECKINCVKGKSK